MGFIAYDIAFLVLFTLGVIIFLYTRKHNLTRQGILYLYRTKLGIVYIDKFATKFEKILRPMQYVVLASGYILMLVVLWMIIWTAYLYFKLPITKPIIPPRPGGKNPTPRNAFPPLSSKTKSNSLVSATVPLPGSRTSTLTLTLSPGL